MKNFSFCLGMLILFFCGTGENNLSAQARLVFGSSSTYVRMSGGTPSTPIYLVVDNSNTNAISGASATNGYIISEGDYNLLKWNMGSTNANYVYPFGAGTSAYLPFTFAKTSGNANMAISTYSTVPDNTSLMNGVTNMNPSGSSSDASNMVVDRWWRLQPENVSTAPVADLVFSYRGAENTISGISCGSDILQAQYWDNATTNWITPPFTPGSTCVTTSIGTVSATGVGVFASGTTRPFVLTKQGSPLPVTWLTISADCENGNVNIKWSTASEQNSDYFTVEKSLDGVHFTAAGIIPAAGNSSTVKNYSWTDYDAYGGINVYRVKQTDFDGTFSYSGIITHRGCAGDDVIIYSENGGVNININATERGRYNIEIYDMLGRKISEYTASVDSGNNHIKLYLNSIASASYVVKVYNSKNFIVKKIFTNPLSYPKG